VKQKVRIRFNGLRGRSLSLVFLCLASALAPIRLPAKSAERFWWNGQINGKSVRLVLDTGSPDLFLWRSAADRLGLKLAPVELDSNHWFTAEFELSLPNWERHWGFFSVTAHGPAKASVCEAPVGLQDMDGCVGWPMFRRQITRFNALDDKFEFLGKVPKEVKAWWQFSIRTNVDVLVLDLPGGASQGGLHIDSGMLMGDDVSLPAPLWNHWMAAHPNERGSIWLSSGMGGMIPSKSARASRFSIGELKLTNVVLQSVEECDWSSELKGCAAVIGFELLKRFDLVVDGEHAVAYMRPSHRSKPVTAQPPTQNSVSAAFGPWRDQTNFFTTCVVNASPAFESGIRDGDILLKVDGQDVKQWLDNPGPRWSSDRDRSGMQLTNPSTNSPSGAVVELTLRRQDQVFQVTVLQRGIEVVSLNKVK
jgi:hypothetical protein